MKLSELSKYALHLIQEYGDLEVCRDRDIRYMGKESKRTSLNKTDFELIMMNEKQLRHKIFIF